jgi:type IV/VI secretion system ImpK/VasF family protein
MNSSANLFSPTLNIIEADEIIPMSAPSGFYRSRVYTSGASINPLIVACDPVLILATALKTVEYPSDRDKFLEDLAHEIRAFEHRAQIANYQDEVITAARYALCCLLDETIALTSEWGKDNGWLQNNLLSIFYDESYGGEYFFAIINRALENPTANLHLIELLYICLSFGFVGKYYNTEHGKSELSSITNKLYQAICQHRYLNRRSLFLCEEKPKSQKKPNHDPIFAPRIKTSKLLGVGIVVALILGGLIYFGAHLKLRSISKSLYPLIEHGINIENKGENQT